MEPITIISGYVAKKIIDQLIKEQGYNKIVKFFFPKKKYCDVLVSVINKTIDEYKRKYPIESPEAGSFPFYDSQILFEKLSTHILFDIDEDFSLIKEELTSNKKIILPSEKELLDFYELFITNVNANAKLKKLHFDENYKSKIFDISRSLFKIESAIKELDKKVSSISNLYSPLVSSEYSEREEEQDLLEIIESKNILLLSGISFCGKSQLAMKIAAKFVDDGYIFSNGSEIGEAERFLRNVGTKSIYILEDPFGHNSESEVASKWRKVEELVKTIQAPNKLIITSRSEIIKSIKSEHELSECSINNNNWFDLTNKNKDFLIDSWKVLSQKHDVPNSVINLISEYLKDYSETNILQIGQLSYLSKISNEKLENKGVSDLLHLAMADSKEISIEIKKRNRESHELFIVLGLGATTNIPIKFKEISYILSESENEPGFSKDRGRVTSFFSRGKNKDVNFPKYADEENIESKYFSELGFLQQRGFIEISNELVLFSHPTYTEAAKYILSFDNVDCLNILDPILKKTLSCLNPNTAINCVKQIKFIYNASKNDELKKLIIKHILEANKNSIFPGVRDNCFSFLLEILDELDDDEKSQIIFRLQSKFSNSEIKWKEDIPFIEKGHVNLFDDLSSILKKEEADNILNNLNSKEEVDKKSIWKYILYLEEDISTINLPNSDGIIQIISSDEVFIRNRMVYLVLKKGYPDDDDLLKMIFSDSHPSVIFEAVKGAILGYPNYSKSERKKIKKYIIDSLNDPFILIRSSNLLTTFAIDYGSESIDWKSIVESEKTEIWKLWGELFSIFLIKYPKKIQISNTGRFGATLDESAKYINEEQGLEICEAYFKWIEKQLEIRIPDTYELALLSYLLKVVNINKEKRFELFEKIFSHKDTSFITYSLKWCISYWKLLTKKEKGFILELLKSEREDKRWLKAIAITGYKLPKEIIVLIFKSETFFLQKTKIIVQSFNDELLNDSLSVFFGHPQPLWFLGLNHGGTEIWYKIIKWVLENEHSTGFEICLRQLVSDGVNGYNEEWKDDGLEIWNNLCQNSKNKKRLLNRLIIETSTTSCNISETKNLWSAIIDGYGDNKKELVDTIVDNLELLQANNPYDFDRFFNFEFYRDEIISRFELDYKCILLLQNISISEDLSEFDYSTKIKEIMLESEASDLKLDYTFRFIKMVVEEKKSDIPELIKLNDLPNTLYKIGQEKLSLIDEHYILENWHTLSSNN